MRLIIVITILLSSLVGRAQYWEGTYGGNKNDDFLAITQTHNKDGFICAGTTLSFGGLSLWNQLFLVKVDNFGNEVWQRHYGGPSTDAAFAIRPTSDGNYIVSGEFSVAGTISRIPWLLKIDNNGDTLWTKTYFQNDTLLTIGEDVIETSDSGFFTISNWRKTSISDTAHPIVIKSDSLGNYMWRKDFEFIESNTYTNSICKNRDGNYAFTTYFWNASYPQNQGAIFCINEQADTLWTREVLPHIEHINSTSDSSYVIVGDGSSIGSEIYISKIDHTGNVLWERTYDYAGQLDDEGRLSSIHETDDGFIGFGSLGSFGSNIRGLIVKFNSVGDTLWTKAIDLSARDQFRAGLVTDYGYIAVGITNLNDPTNGDAYIRKMDENGNIITSPLYANFTFDNVCLGDSIVFLDSVSGGAPPYDLHWDFDNGDTSILSDPIYAFDSSGQYNVTLTVTDIYDTVMTDTSFFVSIFDAPGTNFSYDISGLSVDFTDLTTLSLNDSIASWKWAFGDGDSSELQHPNHTYTYEDLYDVCLTTISENGCENSFCEQINVILDNVIEPFGSLKLYPNPAVDYLVIENTQSSPFVLYNTLGEEVLNVPLYQKTERLNVSLPNGLYYYQVGEATGKLVIGSID